MSASAHEVLDLSPGFAAGVQARGHTEFGDPEETTVHGDFGGGGVVTYLVDVDTTLRKRGTPCAHVATDASDRCSE